MVYQRKEVSSVHFESFKTKLPKMHNKVVVITGTTSGTGLIAAQTMVELGAQLLVLNRPSERAERALAKLKETYPTSSIQQVSCDLQSFSAVRKAAEKVKELHPTGIHVLANNAGVMALADEATQDGFDIQMQTNHLSHFLLTKLLFPLLEIGASNLGEARVVNHSSIARLSPTRTLVAQYLEKKGGQLGGNGASMLFGGARWKRYNQTKLANAAFTAALHRRLQAKNSSVKALVAHPGLASTELQVTSSRQGGIGPTFTKLLMSFAQSQEDGAMGLISCMAKSNVKSGEFYGPGSSIIAMKGAPIAFPLEPFYDNQRIRNLLWSKSEEAIGEPFIL